MSQIEQDSNVVKTGDKAEVPVTDKESASLGVKRKLEEIETDKENDGGKELNAAEKRENLEGGKPDGEKEICLQHKSGSDSTKVKPEDEDDEELIDTKTNKKQNLVTDQKRVPKPVTDEEEKEETKGELEGTIKGEVDKAVKNEAEGDQEEKGEDFLMEQGEFEKIKEGDHTDEEDQVSLEEESIGNLQDEDKIDLDDYLKKRENI